MERRSPIPERMVQNPRREKSGPLGFCGTGPRRSKIAGTQRRKVAQSRASKDGAGTIPARQRQEARLQMWTFETPGDSDYYNRRKYMKDTRRTFTGQKQPSPSLCPKIFTNKGIRFEGRNVADPRLVLNLLVLRSVSESLSERIVPFCPIQVRHMSFAS